MITIVSADKLFSTLAQLEAKFQSSNNEWLCLLCSELSTQESAFIATGITDAIYPAAFITDWVRRSHRKQIRLLFLQNLQSLRTQKLLSNAETVTAEEFARLCKYALLQSVNTLNASE